MSMRAPVMLLVLFAYGLVDAQATAPSIIDPRNDLYEESPNPPAIPPSPSAPMPKPPNAKVAPTGEQGAVGKTSLPADKSATAEPELPANPLWQIPLSSLPETRARPPFSANRRPPQAVTVTKPVAAPPPKPIEPVTPQLSLVGTVVGGSSRIGIFFNSADKRTLHLKAGEKHDGWVLRAVETHQVELANGLERTVLKLPPVDMKPTAAVPVAPLQAAIAPQQGKPVSSSPVNAATLAATAPLMGNMPSFATQRLIKPDSAKGQ